MQLINLFKQKKTPKQTTFVYCPKCKNELISSDSFIHDNNGIVKYECTQCGNISFWDFANYPVPYLLTCANCNHFHMDKTGQDYGCKYKTNCSPDTMEKFEADEKLRELENKKERREKILAEYRTET